MSLWETYGNVKLQTPRCLHQGREHYAQGNKVIIEPKRFMRGEISSDLQGRLDLRMYTMGIDVAQNWFPSPAMRVLRRPGRRHGQRWAKGVESLTSIAIGKLQGIMRVWRIYQQSSRTLGEPHGS